MSERVFSVTDRLLDDYYAGLQLDPSEGGGRLPTTIAADAESTYFNEIAYPYQQGHLWLRQQWWMHSPLEQNQPYDVVGSIKDIYQRRDRNVVDYEVRIRNSSQGVVARSRHHQSFLREELPGDRVSFRDPKRKPGARKFLVPEGEGFGGLQRCITKEMCGQFFHGDANYHTDEIAANKLGFAQIVVGGKMTMSYTAHVLEEYYGERWWLSGQLDIKFTNPAWCDDIVTVRGVDTGTSADGDRDTAFVWITKEDGTVILIANASVSHT